MYAYIPKTQDEDNEIIFFATKKSSRKNREEMMINGIFL